MTRLFKLAVPAVAFSAFAVVAMSNTTAVAAPAMHPGGYCLTYEQDEMDCSFSTFAQCEATASGIGGDCSVDVSRDDEHAFARPNFARR